MFGGQKSRKTGHDRLLIKESANRKHAKARNLILSLLAFPLISCGPQLNRAPPQAPSIELKAAPQETEKTNCSFDYSETATTITYERAGKKLKLELDVPDGVNFSRQIRVFCQDKRTVVVTRNYAIRALGYDDVAGGKQMLGVLADGSFNPQNAIVFNLSPLGDIVDASAAENIVIVSNSMGKRFGIDVDNPAKPARHLAGPGNNKSL